MSATVSPGHQVDARFLELAEQYDEGTTDLDRFLAVVKAYSKIKTEFGHATVAAWIDSVVGPTDPAEVAAFSRLETAYGLPEAADRRAAIEALLDAPGLVDGLARQFLTEAG